MASRLMFVAVVSTFLASLPASGAPAPQVGVDSVNALSLPEHPYDTGADADRAVAQAFAHAAQDHKRVLIDLGGNWCADCRILSGVMALPEMQAFIDAHYEVVLVDVGRIDKNLQIPARFGITKKFEGVPVILIAAPDGTLVNQGHVEALAEARNMTPQAIADWLAFWAR